MGLGIKSITGESKLGNMYSRQRKTGKKAQRQERRFSIWELESSLVWLERCRYRLDTREKGKSMNRVQITKGLSLFLRTCIVPRLSWYSLGERQAHLFLVEFTFWVREGKINNVK